MTLASYSSMIANPIGPYFRARRITLEKLQARDIQLFYAKELERVKANTVIYDHAIICKALKYKERLGEETVRRILAREIACKPKPNRTPVVKVRKEVYARYFKAGMLARDVQGIVEKALAMYFKEALFKSQQAAMLLNN